MYVVLRIVRKQKKCLTGILNLSLCMHQPRLIADICSYTLLNFDRRFSIDFYGTVPSYTYMFPGPTYRLKPPSIFYVILQGEAAAAPPPPAAAVSA